MKTLQELRAAYHDALKEAGDLLELSMTEDRDFSEDEQSKYDALKAKAARYKSQISELEALEESRGSVSEPKQESRAQDAGKEPEARSHIEFIDNPKKQWRDFGEFIRAVIQAGNPMSRKVDERLLCPDGIPHEKRAGLGLNEAVDAQGGYLVDQPLSDELLTKAFETGVLFPRARQIPIRADANGIKINAVDDNDRTDGNRWGGVTADWVAEGATTPEGRPTFRQIELSLNKLLGFVYATDEMMQDAQATASIIQQSMSEELAFRIDDAVYRGDGTGKPLGLLNSGAKIAITRDTASEIRFPDIVAMEEALWSRSDARAIYYAHRSIFPQLMNMAFKTSAGDQHPVFLTMNAGATEAPRRTLMGREIRFLEQASALGTEGDLMLCDMSQYLLAVKGGLRSAMSIHVRFLQEESCFRFSYRVDGTHAWDAPLTRAQGGGQESPLITIAA